MLHSNYEESRMNRTRRDVAEIDLAALLGARLFARPTSAFDGEIPFIAPYSFHGMGRGSDALILRRVARDAA